MRSSEDHEHRVFKPGEAVPTSGVYTAVHQNHREPHEVVAIQGEEFPGCRQCKREVRFHATRLLPHMTHDFDLSGPDPRSFKGQAKAAGEGGE